MLAGMEKSDGGRPTKTGNIVLPVSTLSDHGITKMQSSRWQAESVPNWRQTADGTNWYQINPGRRHEGGSTRNGGLPPTGNSHATRSMSNPSGASISGGVHRSATSPTGRLG